MVKIQISIDIETNKSIGVWAIEHSYRNKRKATAAILQDYFEKFPIRNVDKAQGEVV